MSPRSALDRRGRYAASMGRVRGRAGAAPVA
jgi:hypothetical protein